MAAAAETTSDFAFSCLFCNPLLRACVRESQLEKSVIAEARHSIEDSLEDVLKALGFFFKVFVFRES